MSAYVKKLYPDAKLPTYGSAKAACADLYAYITEDDADYIVDGVKKEIMIQPHTTRKIGTGLAITPPRNKAGFIYARSGLATKHGLRPANCVGM